MAAKKKKRRRDTLTKAAAFGLALLSVYFLFFRGSGSPPQGNLVPVRRTSFEVRVATVGHLDTAQAYHVVSGIRGDRGKIIKIVEDGAKVEKGDVLVQLDPTFFELEKQRLTGEIKSHEAMVEYASQMLKLAQSQAEKAVSNERMDQNDAKQEHERYQSYIAELQALKARGYEISSEITQAKRKSDQAFTKLQKSKVDVERVRKESAFKVAQAMADFNKIKGALETLIVSRNQISEEFEKTTLRAPTAGFAVLHETTTPGEPPHKLRVGDTVWQGQPILYLPDPSLMVVKSQVREVDLHKIGIGMKALVRVDAYPDTSLEGQVESIGTLAAESSGSTDKNFQFTVKLRGNDPRLRPGMTSRVFILVGQAENVLSIPLTALFSEGGRNHCYVLNSGKLVSQAVGVGQMNDEMVEITSGLSEGDRVSLVKP